LQTFYVYHATKTCSAVLVLTICPSKDVHMPAMLVSSQGVRQYQNEKVFNDVLLFVASFKKS
jgi:hypothetical protein